MFDPWQCPPGNGGEGRNRLVENDIAMNQAERKVPTKNR
jgi:hypothetical protein